MPAKTATLRSRVPARLVAELEALVEAGWSRSVDEIVADALRRYVDSHRDVLLEEFVREDVEWALRGSD